MKGREFTIKKIPVGGANGGLFFQVPEGIDMQNEHSRELMNELMARKILKYTTFPIKCAWLALFCWPGLHYIASTASLSSPGYMGSFGVVSLILCVGLVIRK